MSKLENLIIMNFHEKYDKNFKPSLVRAETDPAKADLMCFYIQLAAARVKDNLSLDSNHVAEILSRFYGFEYLGFIKIKDFECEAQISYDPWNSNWEKYSRIADLVETIGLFKRDGLEDYIKNLYKTHYQPFKEGEGA